VNSSLTHDPSTPAALEQMVRRYYELFNERKLDEAAEFVDRQATFHYLPTRQRLIGRAGYRALVAAWLNAFEDAQLEIRSVLVLNDHSVQIEFVGHGTHTGDLELGEALSIPATGRKAELPFHDILEIRNGVIISAELDFDVEEMKRRLLGQ
jgi:predicted ester cyclase